MNEFLALVAERARREAIQELVFNAILSRVERWCGSDTLNLQACEVYRPECTFTLPEPDVSNVNAMQLIRCSSKCLRRHEYPPRLELMRYGFSSHVTKECAICKDQVQGDRMYYCMVCHEHVCRNCAAERDKATLDDELKRALLIAFFRMFDLQCDMVKICSAFQLRCVNDISCIASQLIHQNRLCEDSHRKFRTMIIRVQQMFVSAEEHAQCGLVGAILCANKTSVDIPADIWKRIQFHILTDAFEAYYKAKSRESSYAPAYVLEAD